MRLLILCFLLFLTDKSAGTQPSQQRERNECDFSEYKYVVVSDHEIPVKKKVKAEYPPIAKEAKAIGFVQVKVLVDKEGNVVRACATQGHPMLKRSAVTAAQQWKFARNSGLRLKQKIKYMQQWVFFNYIIDGGKS